MWGYPYILLAIAYVIVEGDPNDTYIPSIQPVSVPSIVPTPNPINVPPPKNWTTLKCAMCLPGSYATSLCGIPRNQSNDSTPVCPTGQCLAYGKGWTNCTLCSPGSHQRIAGATRCFQCNPGSYSSEMGARNCDLCPVRYYCPGLGSTKPTICSIGKYCPNMELFQEVECPKGTYCPEEGLSQPKECNAGYFCDGTNREECPDHNYCTAGCVDCPTPCVLLFDSPRRSSSCDPTPLFYVIIGLVVIFIVVVLAVIWKVAKERIREDNEYKQSMEITSLIPRAEGPKYTGL